MGFKYCTMDIDDYVFSRRCFMTGEYCSKQLNVQRERERLHRKGEINAFVIMSFTNMSDVVYKWRIQSYVESLAKHLYFRSEKGIDSSEIVKCFTEIKNLCSGNDKDTKEQTDAKAQNDNDKEKKKKEKKCFSSYLRAVSSLDKDFFERLGKEETNAAREARDSASESEKDSKEANARKPYQKLRVALQYKRMTELCCYANEDAHLNTIKHDYSGNKTQNKPGKYYPELKVQKINVIRADSNPSSNFVICNRVCQQMQIADLVVVDVSDENTNVFYELGMAIALRKLILPICYSESYFAMEFPEGVKEERQERLRRFRKDFRYDPTSFADGDYGIEKEEGQGKKKHIYKDKTDKDKGSVEYNPGDNEDNYLMHNRIVNDLEYHIDCYPWRRQLFEHFGIRFRKGKDASSRDATYLSFDIVKEKLFGFSDLKYDRFPYLEEVKDLKIGGKITTEEKNVSIGNVLYDHLKNAYNLSSEKENTLVVYSIDRFLNPDDGGQCIVNYYRAYVKRMQDEYCFCGDRVGLLVQPTSIAEPIKDAEVRRHLLYNIGEIIQIGMNQATYLADREMIKPPEYLPEFNIGDSGYEGETASSTNEDPDDENRNAELQEWDNETRVFIKDYIRNRSFPIYPKDPVYISRVKSGAHDDLFDDCMKGASPEPQVGEHKSEAGHDLFFCLYHIMLRNLKYVNEIAVDISQNSVQSLFWLGAAHASGIYAITIRHDKTEEEKKQLAEAGEERGQHFPSGSGRRIFDISGLWTAVLHAYDTEGFYTQLKRVQLGIEQRSKLMLRDADSLNEEMSDVFWDPNVFSQKKEGFEKESAKVYTEKKKRETELLESFYRDRFWRPMLKRNRLEIYACQDDVKDANPPRSYVAAWDIEAISALSLYLSKRKLIGEYQFKLHKRVRSEIPESEKPELVQPEELAKKSYICVGAQVNPFSITKTILEYLNSKENDGNRIIKQDLFTWCNPENHGSCPNATRRGFYNESRAPLQRPYACVECANCAERKDECEIRKNGEHVLLGQLLLWREETVDKEYAFRASLAGDSGPATRALSTLFVDEAQKEEAFQESHAANHSGETLQQDGTQTHKSDYLTYTAAGESWDNARIIEWEDSCNKPLNAVTLLFPLSALQKEIRAILLSKYKTLLRAALGEVLVNVESTETEKADYIARVINTSELYLSTNLYRFFFPYLSHEDEARIYNGMGLFFHKMTADKRSPFAKVYNKHNKDNVTPILDNTNSSAIIYDTDVELAASKAVDILQTLLSNIQAIEAFYEVDVGFNCKNNPPHRHNIYGINLAERQPYEKESITQGEESTKYLIRFIYKETPQEYSSMD